MNPGRLKLGGVNLCLLGPWWPDCSVRAVALDPEADTDTVGNQMDLLKIKVVRVLEKAGDRQAAEQGGVAGGMSWGGARMARWRLAQLVGRTIWQGLAGKLVLLYCGLISLIVDRWRVRSGE